MVVEHGIIDSYIERQSGLADGHAIMRQYAGDLALQYQNTEVYDEDIDSTLAEIDRRCTSTPQSQWTGVHYTLREIAQDPIRLQAYAKMLKVERAVIQKLTEDGDIVFAPELDVSVLITHKN